VVRFFVSFRIFFSDNTRVRIFIFFCREIFLQNLKLGYMTKTLNQIIFFSSTKIRIFISATPFKLNGRSLSSPTVPYDFFIFFFFFYKYFSFDCKQQSINHVHIWIIFKSISHCTWYILCNLKRTILSVHVLDLPYYI
jgi:hypothetical protein